MTFLGDMSPKDISDYVERCEDQKLNEHERAENDVKCIVTDCNAEGIRKFGEEWYCDEHYEQAREDFGDAAREAAMDLGLTEDEAEREVEEYSDLIS